MVEKPGPIHEDEEDFFDGSAQLGKLLGLGKGPSSTKGWIKDISEISDDDPAELLKGKRPLVDRGGSS